MGTVGTVHTFGRRAVRWFVVLPRPRIELVLCFVPYYFRSFLFSWNNLGTLDDLFALFKDWVQGAPDHWNVDTCFLTNNSPVTVASCFGQLHI